MLYYVDVFEFFELFLMVGFYVYCIYVSFEDCKVYMVYECILEELKSLYCIDFVL